MEYIYSEIVLTDYRCGVECWMPSPSISGVPHICVCSLWGSISTGGSPGYSLWDSEKTWSNTSLSAGVSIICIQYYIRLNVGLRCLHLLIVFYELKDVCSFKRTIGRSSDQPSTSRSTRHSLSLLHHQRALSGVDLVIKKSSRSIGLPSHNHSHPQRSQCMDLGSNFMNFILI